MVSLEKEILTTFCDIQNCKVTFVNEKPVLTAPENSSEQLLKRYGFIQNLSGDWVKYPSPEEFSQLKKVYVPKQTEQESRRKHSDITEFIIYSIQNASSFLLKIVLAFAAITDLLYWLKYISDTWNWCSWIFITATAMTMFVPAWKTEKQGQAARKLNRILNAIKWICYGITGITCIMCIVIWIIKVCL